MLVQAVRPSLREGKQSTAAKHHMLGQRWKEMTLQWKSPWYAPCFIRDNLQKYGLKEYTTLMRRHRKTFCCLILKLEGTDLLSAAAKAVNEQTKKPAELGAATMHSNSDSVIFGFTSNSVQPSTLTHALWTLL